jgi:hypothetical protein
MDMAALIFMAAVAILSSWLFTRAYFSLSLFSDTILVCFILLFAQIVLIELFLGVSGKFFFLNVFTAHLLILALAIIAYRNKKIPRLLRPEIEVFLSSKLILFAFSVFLAFFLVKGYVNLVNPPISPDSLQGHLAFPATWIMRGNLENRLCIFGATPILHPGSLETTAGTYYPINAQLFFAWLMLPLRNAFLADMGEAPFYIIGIIAVYSILRKYNIEKTLALLSGFIWVLIPNIFKQLKTASQVDVICAVLFLLVFYALLLLKRSFTLRNSLFFGISVGLFVGTKIINLVWLIALMPVICYMFYRGARVTKASLSKILYSLCAIVLPIILFGGFMYIKNFVLLGNPVFPVELTVFGKTIFKGLIDNATYATKIAPGDGFDFMRLTFREGLGLQFLFLILPGTFIPLLFYRYLKKRKYPIGEYMLIFATPLIMLVLYSLYINIFIVRYLFPYVSFGLITAIIFVTRFSKGGKYLAPVSFLSIFVASFELASKYELITSILLYLVIFTALAIYREKLSVFYRSKELSKYLLIFLFLLSLFLVYSNGRYNQEEFDRYPKTFSKKESWQADIGRGWKYLNELTGRGSRLAYTGRQEVYPFFGTKLKNEVKYISINEKEASPYNKPDGLYRKIKDFSAWEGNLKKERIEYLFIALPFEINRESEDPKKFPIEDEWAAAHPDDFRLVFSNSLSHIYKVLLN